MEINRRYIGCFGKQPKFKPTAIVIHHTCTSSPKRTMETLKKRGYSTHFEIDLDGTIYQYSEIDSQCIHCGSPNFCCIGIDITHMKDAEFTDSQIESCKWLVSYLCNKLEIPQIAHTQLSGIYPHKALACTACPQDFPIDCLGE